AGNPRVAEHRFLRSVFFGCLIGLFGGFRRLFTRLFGRLLRGFFGGLNRTLLFLLLFRTGERRFPFERGRTGNLFLLLGFLVSQDEIVVLRGLFWIASTLPFRIRF